MRFFVPVQQVDKKNGKELVPEQELAITTCHGTKDGRTLSQESVQSLIDKLKLDVEVTPEAKAIFLYVTGYQYVREGFEDFYTNTGVIYVVNGELSPVINARFFKECERINKVTFRKNFAIITVSDINIVIVTQAITPEMAKRVAGPVQSLVDSFNVEGPQRTNKRPEGEVTLDVEKVLAKLREPTSR